MVKKKNFSQRNNMNNPQLDVTLNEVTQSEPKNVRLNVVLERDGLGLAIGAEGYGHNEMGGDAPFILIEVHEGRLKLYINNDINDSEPTIIDLEGARHSNRITDDEDG